MTIGEGRRILLETISEASFQTTVIKWAKQRGWRVSAMHDSRKLWWGVDKGFPDLFMVRGNRVLCAELKDMKGRLTKDQKAWCEALYFSPVEYFIWRPSDEDEIKGVLA